jgi:hypothetical protein
MTSNSGSARHHIAAARPIHYTTLTLGEVRGAILDVAHETPARFGGLSARQLNWRPDEGRWSVAQCLQHLLTSNELMLKAANDALTHPPSSVWQRMPFLPAFFGPTMVRSLAPAATRKYTAPAKARPTTSDIAADIVDRFVRQHVDAADWMLTVNQDEAARRIMISPFARVVTYSVLDGCRLLIAHDHRHLQQARRVAAADGFPES